MAEENKVSAGAIMKRLDAIAASTLILNPKNLVLYKPNTRDPSRGVACKISYRFFVPEVEGKPATFFNGGCFLEIVTQLPESTDEYPRFDWKNDNGKNVTVKLGLPDLSAMLLAYREYRVFRRPVPTAVRPIAKVDGKWVPSAEENQLGLVHKFENETTFIKWTFSDDNRSMLEIAKSKELRRSVSLGVAEELQLTRYMELAMDALLLTNA